ncbi:MAG: C-GCAxxG-C-C family protein [Syntrophaceae bacterium]|nr:C-GCAxxG-C-C family protein [Syntrophaceae bacterium]
MKLSRRGLLKEGGVFLLGATAAGLSFSRSGELMSAVAANQETMEVPWPYKKLNPEVVAEKAYHGYYKGACCYGVFDSIVGELRREIGAPYTTIPTSMMIFGEGGVAGIASVCGALNGAAAAIFLITGSMEKEKRELAFSITKELFNWYEQVPLPDYRPSKPKFEIVKSISRSNLCHASVSNWCKVAKVKAFSKERSERCGWLTGSVAKYTVELLNANAEGNFKAIHKLSKEVQSCRSCHDKGGAIENTRGMMDCGGCHFRAPSKHPKI